MTSGGWMTPHYGMIKENRGEGIILLLYIHILGSLFFLFEFYDLYYLVGKCISKDTSTARRSYEIN